MVERLYRAGQRMDAAKSIQERVLAARWLTAWNRALQTEHARNLHL